MLPFVKVLASPDTAINACYFFNRREADGFKFVSYHFEDKDSVTDAFPDMEEALAVLVGGAKGHSIPSERLREAVRAAVEVPAHLRLERRLVVGGVGKGPAPREDPVRKEVSKTSSNVDGSEMRRRNRVPSSRTSRCRGHVVPTRCCRTAPRTFDGARLTPLRDEAPQ